MFNLPHGKVASPMLFRLMVSASSAVLALSPVAPAKADESRLVPVCSAAGLRWMELPADRAPATPDTHAACHAASVGDRPKVSNQKRISA